MKWLALLALACWAAVAVAAAGGRNAVVVSSVKDPMLGSILVSSSGRTLYHSSAEPKNRVRCDGQCAQDWPPLLVARGVKPVAGQGVRSSLLGTVRRSDGTLQVTYAGMPLYLYSGDKRRGSVEGQGVGGATWLGGTWNAVTPAGGVVKSVSSSSGSNKSSSSGDAPAPGMTCY